MTPTGDGQDPPLIFEERVIADHKFESSVMQHQLGGQALHRSEQKYHFCCKVRYFDTSIGSDCVQNVIFLHPLLNLLNLWKTSIVCTEPVFDIQHR